MVNRWRALPPHTRMWVMGGAVWLPLILLELVLGILVGSTRAWTPIFVSLIVIGVVTGGTCWVQGAMRAVRDGRCQAPAEHAGLAAWVWYALSALRRECARRRPDMTGEHLTILDTVNALPPVCVQSYSRRAARQEVSSVPGRRCPR
jgi:hypothetical protein